MRPGDFFLATKGGSLRRPGLGVRLPDVSRPGRLPRPCPTGARGVGVWGGFSPQARAKLAALLDTGSMTWDDILRSSVSPSVLP